MNMVLSKRDFTPTLLPPLGLEVESYSRNVWGGSLRASINATGSQRALFELVEYLRAPVVIYDRHDAAVWWGYLSGLTIVWQNIRYGLSLDTMSNKIAVAYTDGSVRYTTTWSTDSDSSTAYGTKENLLSLSEVSAANALQRRDTELQARKYPVPTIRSGRGGEDLGRATLTCRSWMDTLDWRYYTNAAGMESYEVLGSNAGREIGEDDRPIYAQAFQLSSSAGWTATSVWIRLYKVGAPVDNFQLGLYSDSAGNPNAALATATVAGANVTTNGTWTEFTLSVPVALSTGTTYWIHNSRSGAVDADNYYVIGNNPENGYLLGAPKYYNTNTAAWVDASHKGDQNFRVMGNEATTAQISTLVTAVGEFLTGTSIENASGVNTNPYRAGDNTALWELNKLLASGTTNDRRLLAEVTPGRVLRVYEEPAAPAANTNVHSLLGNGTLISPYGQPVLASDCPVGFWCRLIDVVPSSVDLSRLSNPILFFVDEAEYDARNDSYAITRARSQADVFAFGGVE